MKNLRLGYGYCVLAFSAVASLGSGWAAGDGAQMGNDETAEVARLIEQLRQQQKQLAAMQVALEQQQKMLDEILRKKSASLGEVASTAPMIPSGPETASANPLSFPHSMPSQNAAEPKPSPLSIQIGNATITPVGFMDLTNTYRSTNSGASLATNFGNIPYNNTVPGRLTEDKFSAQNSRIGFRVDATFKDWHVLGYYEGDFVGGYGNGAFNTQVTSDSVFTAFVCIGWMSARRSLRCWPASRGAC